MTNDVKNRKMNVDVITKKLHQTMDVNLDDIPLKCTNGDIRRLRDCLVCILTLCEETVPELLGIISLSNHKGTLVIEWLGNNHYESYCKVAEKAWASFFGECRIEHIVGDEVHNTEIYSKKAYESCAQRY